MCKARSRYTRTFHHSPAPPACTSSAPRSACGPPICPSPPPRPRLAGGTPVESVDYEVIVDGAVLAKATAPPGASVALRMPSPRLWSPASPTLYDLRVTAGGDTVLGYFGMRSFSVGRDNADGVVRPMLNGQPTFMAGWLDQVRRSRRYVRSPGQKPMPAQLALGCGRLYRTRPVQTPAAPRMRPTLPQPARDTSVRQRRQLEDRSPLPTLPPPPPQSYWPDGLYTAPTDAALRSDLEAVSTFGYNTVRLHQKVNPERWYLHADQLGVLVLQDAIQVSGMGLGFRAESSARVGTGPASRLSSRDSGSGRDLPTHRKLSPLYTF